MTELKLISLFRFGNQNRLETRGIKASYMELLSCDVYSEAEIEEISPEYSLEGLMLKLEL